MITVEVKLKSAISPNRDRDLVTLHIWNTGDGTKTRGNYGVQVIHPGGKRGRMGEVKNYPREAVAVGNLIRQALESVGYTR